MDKFMACYKKEFADQKKGNVDEREADAVSIDIEWAVKEGNVFV